MLRIRAFLLAAALATGAARAEPLEVAEQPIDAVRVIPLYAGTAPGSETWTWQEQVSPGIEGNRVPSGRLVRNVRQPTLSMFVPGVAARKTRTAVIVAPGGGFRWLSIDSEGYDVARALTARGATAFVLKYRLNRTPADEAKFQEDTRAFMGAVMRRGAGPAGARPAAPPPPPRPPEGIADGLAAVRYVRDHAAELGVDPDRIGLVGFSAGSGVTVGTLLGYDAASRPNFAGLIYGGAPADAAWKPDSPPVFMAVAGDDFLLPSALDAFAGLRAAKVPVELHVYAKGGHGFGMVQQGTTSDLWFGQFADWMASLGYLTPAR